MNDMLQKLEDRVINLVDELDALRGRLSAMVRENQELRQQNNSLRQENEQVQNLSVAEKEKLQSILSLLDGVENTSVETAQTVA